MGVERSRTYCFFGRIDELLDFESKIVADDFLIVWFEVYLNQIYSITNIPTMMESTTLNTIGIVQWPNDQSVTIMCRGQNYQLPAAKSGQKLVLSIINAYKLRFDDQALLIYMASLIGHLDSLIVECGLMKSLNKKKFLFFPLPSCHLAILPSWHLSIVPSWHLSIVPTCHSAILPSYHLAKWSKLSFNLTKTWERDGLNLKWHLQPQAKITIFEHSCNDVWYAHRHRRKRTRKVRASKKMGKWRFRM